MNDHPAVFHLLKIKASIIRGVYVSQQQHNRSVTESGFSKLNLNLNSAAKLLAFGFKVSETRTSSNR